MGIFDFLKPKPKQCEVCFKEFKKLHKYNSTYCRHRQNNFPRRMCTDCFLAAFKADLLNFKARIVFQEPIVEEGYAFTMFIDEPSTKLIAEPLKTFLAPEGTKCVKCANPAPFTWVTSDIIADHSHLLAFKTIEEFSGYQYLCAEHLLEEFATETTRRNFFYMEFWPVRGTHDGYCH